jgi:uncharacterized protein
VRIFAAMPKLAIAVFATTVALFTLIGCSKKEAAISKSDNGEVTTTTVTDNKGNSLKMQVDDSECSTKEACIKLAASFDSKDKRFTEAAKRACDLGEPAGCGIAAGTYHDGQGVTKDFTTARTLAQKGCDQNDAFACALLSLIYLNGEGVDADHGKSLELASRGCDAAGSDETDSDVAAACSNAGIMLGDAKPVDQAKVRRYLERGCAIDAKQCTNLGVATASGLLGPKDEAKAREIYKKACDADVADACSALGRQLIDGNGGPKDAALAKTLFDKACKAGSKNGCINQKKFP